jgi:hypothetical protein
MIALPVVSASIGILLGVARVRLTALFVVLGAMAVTLGLWVTIGTGAVGAVVSGVVAAGVLQVAYVLALAVRACGPVGHGITRQR